MIPCLILLFGLAAANGANDVSRAAATLLGGGLASFRKALFWTVAWTLCGSLLSTRLALAVAQRFAAGFAPNQLHLQEAVAAALAGSILTIVVATTKRIPVATTHALLGGVFAVAWLAGGAAGVERLHLLKGFVTPLLLSPVIAMVSSLALQWCVRWLPVKNAKSLDGAHWLSSGLVAFSRGVNDSAKIWAPLLPLVGSGQPALWSISFTVALGMLAGGLLAGRRVTETVAFRIAMMQRIDSLCANLMTFVVLITASLMSFPAASSHVVGGAVLGVGLGGRDGVVNRRILPEIGLSWLLTLPASAALSALFFLAFRSSAIALPAFLAMALIAGSAALGRYAYSPKRREKLIIFVCSGNTSRSPMAAYLCSKLLAKKDGVISLSRGLEVLTAKPMTALAQATLRERGIAPEPHESKLLTQDLAASADRIYCMTERQVAHARMMFPAAIARIERLHPECDIEDPSSGGESVYLRVADRLTEAIQLRLAA